MVAGRRGSSNMARRQRATALALALVMVTASLATALSTASSAASNIVSGLVRREEHHSKDDLSSLYLSASRDMGVTHCILQGALRNTTEFPRRLEPPCKAFSAFPTQIYQPPANFFKTFNATPQEEVGNCRNETLVNLHLFMKMVVTDGVGYLRGFAKIERHGHFDVAFRFLSNTPDHELWSHEIWLGSARTGKKYGPIQVNRNVTGQATKHFFFEPLHLEADDHMHPEFEVYSEGFGYSCYLMPTYKSSLTSMMSKASPALVRPTANPAISRRNIFLLSPFFIRSPLKPAHIAKLLHWSLMWHAHYGVDTYVLYVARDLPEFLELPIVQELIRTGRLVVIHWDGFPGLITPLFTGNESVELCLEYIGYWHQWIIYNHFYVSMWLENVLVFEADLDEWLITNKPMTLVDVMNECGLANKQDDPVSQVQLLRQVGYCTHCNETTELELWVNSTLTSNVGDHPILEYSVGRIDRKPKSIMRPDYIYAVDPHTGISLEGSVPLLVNETTCAYVLHMACMMSERHYRGQGEVSNMVDPPGVQDEQLWPLRQRLKHSSSHHLRRSWV